MNQSAALFRTALRCVFSWLLAPPTFISVRFVQLHRRASQHRSTQHAMCGLPLPWALAPAPPVTWPRFRIDRGGPNRLPPPRACLCRPLPPQARASWPKILLDPAQFPPQIFFLDDLVAIAKAVRYSLKQLDEVRGERYTFVCCARRADGKHALLYVTSFGQNHSVSSIVARGMKLVFDDIVLSSRTGQAARRGSSVVGPFMRWVPPWGAPVAVVSSHLRHRSDRSRLLLNLMLVTLYGLPCHPLPWRQPDLPAHLPSPPPAHLPFPSPAHPDRLAPAHPPLRNALWLTPPPSPPCIVLLHFREALVYQCLWDRGFNSTTTLMARRCGSKKMLAPTQLPLIEKARCILLLQRRRKYLWRPRSCVRSGCSCAAASRGGCC